jgi:trans-aconitate 2-methyltransferase
MTDTWNPAQYEKFRAERELPGADLQSMIHTVRSPRVIDLGCGTGRLTRRLHEGLAARETIGVDRSARMLDAARADAPLPGLRFELGDISQFEAGAEYDVVFSNAALHWVQDHAAFIPRLARALRPSGQLAFQVPAMHDDLSHLVAEELTAVEPFAAAFGGWRRPQPVLGADEYARLLYRGGLRRQRVQAVIYPHVLESRDAVVEWMRGTLLTEYERHLPPTLHGRFLEEYRARLLPRLPDQRPFFFPFTRILCWGQLC